MNMHEAMLYDKEADLKVRCRLCRHGCHIAEGKKGICNVRENKDGTLYSIFYAKPVAINIDPIEKKPLFHYFPGSKALSIATPGCNFQCPWCQNWDISQYGRIEFDRIPTKDVPPESIIAQAKAHKCRSISYTYTEPTIFFEYAYDCAKLARAEGLGSNFVTNGYMTREAIDTIKPFLDAANIDLKAFRKDTYRRLMKGQLDGVCDSIKYMKKAGIWIEVTTLIVPKMNDDPAEIKDIAEFLVETGRDIPWHISRFYPHYKYENAEPTPVTTLEKAYEIGKAAGLRYIYMGNVMGDPAESTYCYNCDTKLISRMGYNIEENQITEKSLCPKCGAEIDGIGMGKK
jgi:pyruvate formate lyase activating enzyme